MEEVVLPSNAANNVMNAPMILPFMYFTDSDGDEGEIINEGEIEIESNPVGLIFDSPCYCDLGRKIRKYDDLFILHFPCVIGFNCFHAYFDKMLPINLI